MNSDGVRRRRVLRATGGAVGVGALAYGSSRPTRAQSDEAWSQFGYGDANTRHAPENTGPVTDIAQQWAVETGDSVGSSPAVADETVYVGSADYSVYAIRGTSATPATQSTDASGPGFGLLSAAVGLGLAGLFKAFSTDLKTDERTQCCGSNDSPPHHTCRQSD